jgi:hypothetical protein
MINVNRSLLCEKLTPAGHRAGALEATAAGVI